LSSFRARGAPAALIEAIARSGLPGDAACGAVASVGLLNCIRLIFLPNAPLSARERAMLEAVAELAVEVAADEGDAEGARRFWLASMPWLHGKTPAYWLARGDIGGIVDLRRRINFGIPP
jgi:hypothetical protein